MRVIDARAPSRYAARGEPAAGYRREREDGSPMRALGWLYLLAMAAIAAVQLHLGADLWVLSVLLVIAAAAAIPFTNSAWRVSDGLYAIMTVYFGTAGLVVKTLAGQPVQSNLRVPDLSAGYLLAGFASITIGYGLSQRVRRPLRFADDLRALTAHTPNLERLAMPVFLLGALFLLLQTKFRANAMHGGFEAGGFGGFGAFYPLLPLGAAMQAALVARRQSRPWWHALVLAAMALVILALTLADNTKRTLFDFLFVGLAFVALGGGRRWTWIVPGAIGAGVALLLIAPAIQIVRTQADVRGIARIGATWQVLRDHGFDPARLAGAGERIATGYQRAWRDSYVYPLTWNTERFTMIQPIDQVARAIGERGAMGGTDLWRDPAETLLPGFLIRKTFVTAPDRIAWHFGFRANGSIARPVVGLVASSLAAFGLAGVLLLPALVVAFTFVMLDLVGGRIAGNVWAVFLLATTAFLAEREVSTTLSFFCRSFPFILLTGGALLLVGARRVARVRTV
jgi:hypothetical protein